LQDTYTYPAVFVYKKTGGIGIYFPDLDGCVSYGETEAIARKNAREALSLHLYGMEMDNDPIPLPNSAKNVDLDTDQKFFITEVYMPPFRAEMQAQGTYFSQISQEDLAFTN